MNFSILLAYFSKIIDVPWCSQAYRNGAGVGVALRMHPFWEMKDTCVKNSGQNGLRIVQEVLSKDYKH